MGCAQSLCVARREAYLIARGACQGNEKAGMCRPCIASQTYVAYGSKGPMGMRRGSIFRGNDVGVAWVTGAGRGGMSGCDPFMRCGVAGVGARYWLMLGNTTSKRE